MNTWQTAPSLRDELHIDPARVESATLRRYDRRADRGTVQGGDWDLNTKALEETRFQLNELPYRRETHYALLDEVSVCIDRHGHFILEAGRHRFCSARLFDINSISAYRNFSPSEFVAFVLEHSDLTQATQLDDAEDGRPVYLLTR